MKLVIIVLIILVLGGCANQSDISNSDTKEHIFKQLTISDQNTDIDYIVENNGEELTALKDGEKIWSANIIEICGKPSVGTPKIRHIQLKEDKIIVTFGKHDFASVDTKSGEVKYLGSD